MTSRCLSVSDHSFNALKQNEKWQFYTFLINYSHGLIISLIFQKEEKNEGTIIYISQRSFV